MPPGKDGAAWSFANTAGRRLLMTVPPSLARSPRELLLGNILLEQGAVTQERLSAFLAKHSRWNGMLGTALEREEIVSKEQLVEQL